MQRKCDIFFPKQVQSERIRFVELFDKNFVYEEGGKYSGYLHASAERIKFVSVVRDLKIDGIDCFNVPIEYRDEENISVKKALDIASQHARTIGASAGPSGGLSSGNPPVFWLFNLRFFDSSDTRVGGTVKVDRLDGHIWTRSEYEEYMYDYNNVL